MDLLEALPTLATLAFVLGSAVVSCRLLLLARRSRGLPELLLGGAIGLTAVLGYGVQIAGVLVRGDAATPEAVPQAAVVLTAGGRVLHDIGVTLNIAFVLHVFRQGVAWAKALAGLMLALLWVGFLAVAAQDGFRDNAVVGSPAWLAEFAVVWSYPVWSMTEAFRYGFLMKKRAALGLASPLVVNRFFLWGWGSLFGTMAIWIASIPFLYANDPATLATISEPVRVATAPLGLASVTCSLFAFAAPSWYRRRVEAAAR